jgi:tetratricopeptide (TPR) repeat protein
MYTLRKLGLALEAERKWTDAEAVHREAWSLSRKKGNQDPEALADLEKLVHVLNNQGELAKAEELLNQALTPEFLMQQPSANLLVQRVNLNGRRGRWREAANDAALALENQPMDHYRYHTLAGLLAMTHDQPGYKTLCQSLVRKFPNPTNPFIAERITQDCLLLPNSGVDLGVIDDLADTAVTLGSGDASMPYFMACKAMSNYRQGRFHEAATWAQKAVNSATTEAPAKAKAFAVLAMANWQVGDKGAAREALTKGDASAPKLSPNDDAMDLGESWVAWLMARISLDEAAGLMNTETAAEINPSLPTENSQP